MQAGHIAFMFMATALVMLMTPGLAFFYGGLVRRKNVLSILLQCFAILCLISVFWAVMGYSLAFGKGNWFIGGLGWFGLQGVGLTPNTDYAPQIPHVLFMLYQMMFAVITPALIIGAFAERMKFTAVMVFSLLWAALVYAPVVHWVWGADGWLKALHVVDFAGGIVVHITSGIAALVMALYLGRRRSFDRGIPPHNLPFTVLGAGLLWFGWYGFNGGSALEASGLAVQAMLVTHLAGAAGGLGYMFFEWLKHGKPTILGTVTGAVAGLATITPASGYVDAGAALWIGFAAALLSFLMITVVKQKLRYDDSLDAFGVHGMCGILGSLAVGIFSSAAINPGVANGLVHGNGSQLVAQLVGVAVVVAYTLVVTYVLVLITELIVGVRVTAKDEDLGLDLSQQNETAYTVLE